MKTPSDPQYRKRRARAEEELQQWASRRPETLPPDPEEQNDDRAEWAEAAILEFQCQVGTDREDALSDLLADLMHWCDRNGLDFKDELERARMHYSEETEGQGAQ